VHKGEDGCRVNDGYGTRCDSGQYLEGDPIDGIEQKGRGSETERNLKGRIVKMTLP